MRGLFKRLTARQVVGLKKPITLFWPDIALLTHSGKEIVCLDIPSQKTSAYMFRKEQQAVAFASWYKKTCTSWYRKEFGNNTWAKKV